MAIINDKKSDQIKDYYKQGFSLQEIADRLGVSLNATVYFFRKHKIPRRTTAESNNIKFQKRPLSFKKNNNLSSNERQLKVAGLMLYWAEGTFRGNTVDMANSDVSMIKIFLKFLRLVYGVDEKKLRIYLYCYGNQNIPSLIKYWSGVTKIPISQFSKPYIRDDYSMKFGREMKYGMVHIRYNDKKLLQDLIEETDRYIDKTNN